MEDSGNEDEDTEGGGVEARGGCVLRCERGDERVLVCVGVLAERKEGRECVSEGHVWYLVHPFRVLRHLRRRIRRGNEMCDGGGRLPWCKVGQWAARGAENQR